MLSKVSLIISLALFSSVITLKGMKYFDLENQIKIQEWQQSQSWKILGIANRLETHLAHQEISGFGKIELHPYKTFQLGFKINDAFQKTLEEIQKELDSQSLLHISWKPLETPTSNFPKSPFLKSGLTVVETSISNPKLGDRSVVRLDTLLNRVRKNNSN